jgi:integrase
MASLVKITVVRHLDAEGRAVPAGTPGAVKVKEKSKNWYAQLEPDETPDGKRRRVPLVGDKRLAKGMLAKLVSEAMRGNFDLLDRNAEHRHRPLAEHLENYGRVLAADGDTPAHVRKTVYRIKAVVDGCGFKVIADLRPTPVKEFLAALRKEREAPPLDPGREWYSAPEVAALLGVSLNSVRLLRNRAGLASEGLGKSRRFPAAAVAALLAGRPRGAGVATSNHYLVAVKGFSAWLRRDGRAAADPLEAVEPLNEAVDVRRRRRALAEGQFNRFIEATAAGGEFRGLSGADRLVLYTLAANTGFRANELASLTPGSFALTGRTATVTVAAGYSKHRREDVQPLRPDVAEMMRQYLAGRPAGSPVWPGNWTGSSAQMVRRDLEAAGLPYRDEAGKVFDFHSLRVQFVTALARNGVHPKEAQTLARHGSITLTMDHYTDLGLSDLSGALDKMPRLPGRDLPATGTGS